MGGGRSHTKQNVVLLGVIHQSHLPARACDTVERNSETRIHDRPACMHASNAGTLAKELPNRQASPHKTVPCPACKTAGGKLHHRPNVPAWAKAVEKAGSKYYGIDKSLLSHLGWSLSL